MADRLQPLRVAIDVSKALGRRDGIGRYTEGVIRGLMEVDGENEYLLVPLLEPASAETFRERFPDVPLNFRFHADPTIVGEADVAHVTAYALPDSISVPLVTTVYDVTFLTSPAQHTLDNRLHCLAGLAESLCRKARLVAISSHSRAEVATELALAESGIEVVYPAVDERFGPSGPELPEELAVEEPYLLAVGTLEPRKNLARLLEAFAALPAEQVGEHRLLVAGGEGWLQEDLARRAVELGVDERVVWLGAVEDAHLPALYRGATALVYPSLAEGFGLPPLEAMACGTPVVVSNRSAMPEVVADAGILVEPRDVGSIRDGIAALLRDGTWRRALGEAGLARAELFSWRESATKMIGVYRAAASDRR